jgi:cellulose synthase/poly-beta-1,6-N-acetylglucosamine synthase-like glycosyltransferase
VVVFRNEKNNLPYLIKSLLDLDYPNDSYEVLLINDHSTDNFENPQLPSNFRWVDLQKTFSKKAGIEKGVGLAKGQMICVTDADCVVPVNWLKSIVSAMDDDTLFLASPVLPQDSNNWLIRIQYCEFMALMGLTGIGIKSKRFWLANGANMTFNKDMFLKLKPYEEMKNIPSGDDVFLIEKIALNYPDRVKFNNDFNSIVRTKGEKKLAGFIIQRIRWAGKFGKFKLDKKVFLMLLVACTNLTLIIVFLLGILSFPLMIGLAMALFIIKLVFDYKFINNISEEFNEPVDVISFLLFSLLYPLLSLIIVILSFVKKQVIWKGRMVKTQ